VRKGARRWEIPKGNSQDLIGKSSVQTRDLGNTIGYCTKVYPELLMAEVESPAIGKRILPYTPESGIRKGSTVLITVASNIPRITDKIYLTGKKIKQEFRLISANKINLKNEIFDKILNQVKKYSD